MIPASQAYRLAAWRYEIGLTFVLVVLGVLTINVWRSAASGPTIRIRTAATTNV